MNSNKSVIQLIQSDLLTDKPIQQTYDVNLSLTRDQISDILNACLGKKIECNNDNIEQYFNIAEQIKSSNLNHKFCNYFAAELKPILQELVSKNSDSYEVSKFHHRMLRKFSNYHSKQDIA